MEGGRSKKGSKNGQSTKFIESLEKRKITKSNSLIEARYRLSLNEQRLILMYISMLTPEHEDLPIVRLKVKDIVKALEINSEKYYSELKELLKKLRSRVLEIPTDTGYIITGWIDSARYYSKKGEIVLRLSPELKPYLLKLKEAFTTYYLKNVLKLRSFYSIRIYELLKQYESVGKRVISIEDLRKILKLEGDKYKKYSDFKRFVIMAAQKELKQKTDIYFDFKEKKIGRKVVELEFFIYRNKDNMVNAFDSDNIKLREEYERLVHKWKNYIEKINPKRLTVSQVIFFLENSLFDLEHTMEVIKLDDRNPKIYNPVGVLMNTLPLRKKPKYFWLLKYEILPENSEIILKWKESFINKFKHAKEIIEKYKLDIDIKKYENPSTEEEAFNFLKELESHIAKKLLKLLSKDEKKLIKNQVKDLKDAELKREILTSLVFQKFNLKSLNLYTN